MICLIIEVVGIGSNVGCLAGIVPNVEQYNQLLLYRELLELKFKRKLSVVSAGSSASLQLVIDKKVPRGTNHFRIGDSVFLGTDVMKGGSLSGLSGDVVLLEAEIAEIKEKGLVPIGETSNITPFESLDEDTHTSGERGYHAIVTIGQLDTDV